MPAESEKFSSSKLTLFKNTVCVALIAGEDSFGGLMVSMLASGTQGRGFKLGRSRWIFMDVKILSMPSSGGE
jgi:hypothetical protein